MTNIITRNTPKGIENGIANIPSAFNLIKFDITNSKNEVRDIRRIIESFTITEELFSPVITLSATIKDTINFFEDFGINGQEIINVEIEKISNNAEINAATPVKNIKLKLAVLEYPNYEKLASSPNIQKYSLIAISDFAYLSALTKISRSIKNNVLTNIYNIFKDDLNVKLLVPKKLPITMFDGIITIQSPLRAAEWLRSKLFDSVGSPFFLFNRISENIPRLSSWSELVNSSSYRKYTYKQKLNITGPSPEAYKDGILRILEMQSNMKLNKLELAKAGAFASVVNVTDLGNKTWTQQIFNADKSQSVIVPNTLETLKVIQDPFKVAFNKGSVTLYTPGKTSKPVALSDMPNASMTNLEVNTVQYPHSQLNSTSGPLLSNIANAKAFSARMSSVTHEVTVYGDLYLNPGRKIDLEIYKAINVEIYDKSTTRNNIDQLDERISGPYIISNVTHSFSDGYYTSKLRVVSDKL